MYMVTTASGRPLATDYDENGDPVSYITYSYEDAQRLYLHWNREFPVSLYRLREVDV